MNEEMNELPDGRATIYDRSFDRVIRHMLLDLGWTRQRTIVACELIALSTTFERPWWAGPDEEDWIVMHWTARCLDIWVLTLNKLNQSGYGEGVEHFVRPSGGWRFINTLRDYIDELWFLQMDAAEGEGILPPGFRSKAKREALAPRQSITESG